MPKLFRAIGARQLLLAALLPALLPAAEPTPARTPSELTVADFFRPPQFTAVRLNPAGTHMALLVFEEKTDSTGLRVFEFATKKATGLRGTKTYDMSEFRWVGDERIVFIAHGEEDQIADASQSHRLARTLKKAGGSCETMFTTGEAHGIAALKNRVELYTRIESFLKKNL